MILALRASAAACQRFGVGDPQKSVIVFAKLDPGSAQLLFDEVVAVEVIVDRKG
jgi:hypothetical protein